MTKKGTLFLLPNLLGPIADHTLQLPNGVEAAVAGIKGLIAESEREGRRYLGRFQTQLPASAIPIAVMGKRMDRAEVDFLLEPLNKGENWGLVSDAGLPCIADPGAAIVARARATGVPIVAFSGPCSITLALMLSGLSAQAFQSCGYLPKEENDRRQKLKALAKRARDEGMTIVFIEAPHRTVHTLQSCLSSLDPDLSLCVAWNLTLPDQGVITQSVDSWRRFPLPNIDKKPAVFVFGKPNLLY